MIHACFVLLTRYVSGEKRTLEQLPHVAASFQASTQRAKSHYLNGTFPRVLEELEVWAKGNSEPAFERLRKPIWVLSEPQGSGKSTLASELCRRLRPDATDSPLGASFFFDLAVEGLSTTRDFFSTISYQLAQSQPVLRPLIVAAANRYLSAGGDLQMEFTAKTLLLEPLRALARSQQQQLAHPIVIVVDGVDECADHATAHALPEMLRHLIACAQEPSSPIRILLTTRPNATVDGILDAPELRGIIHRHHLHDRADARGSDITTYLRARLHKLEAIQRSPTSINKLASHVGPSFAYAQALADFILAHRDHLEIALSPGSAGPSASLCSLYSAITAHTSRLDAHQWSRMRLRVKRPSILNLCGTSTCYGGITRWLCSQQTNSPASSILSQPLPVGLCAHCRTAVANAPLEAWVLKRIVATLVANGLDEAKILPPTPSEGHGREDPWHPEPATSHSRSTNLLSEPRIDRAEAIQLPSPEAPEDLAAGPVTTEPLAPANVERVPSTRATRAEESAGGTPLPEAATVSMPIAQPLEEPFVGGFVAQIQASMAAVSPPAVAPQAAPLPPDALPLPHNDTTPIPTPTAPTTSRPRPPKLRIAISDPPPHTTSPIRLPSPFRAHTHKTPIEQRVHSPTAFRSVSLSTPRVSPRRCSPCARRGPVLLQRLGTPIQQRAASPWDIRRTPNRFTAGSPVRARTGARRDLRQDSPASRRDSPRSPLGATSPDMRRNTA